MWIGSAGVGLGVGQAGQMPEDLVYQVGQSM